MNADLTKSCPSCFASIDGRAARCPHCQTRQPDAPGLYRGVPGKLVGGVCASLAVHFNMDVTVMRVLFLASLLVSGGVAFWAYLAFWMMTPSQPRGTAPLGRMVDWVSRLFSPPTTPVGEPSRPDRHIQQL